MLSYCEADVFNGLHVKYPCPPNNNESLTSLLEAPHGGGRDALEIYRTTNQMSLNFSLTTEISYRSGKAPGVIIGAPSETLANFE